MSRSALPAAPLSAAPIPTGSSGRWSRKSRRWTATVLGTVLLVTAGATGCAGNAAAKKDEGDPERAIATLREAMQTAQRGDLEAAARLARRAAEERPGFVDPWFALAAIEQKRQDLPAARAAYEEILRIDPTQTAAGTALAHTWLVEKDEARAKEWLLRAVESDPGAEAACFNLGSLAEAAGDPESAVGWFRLSAALDGRDPRAPHAAARVRHRQGRAEEARLLVREALRREPEFGPSLALLATLDGNPGSRPE